VCACTHMQRHACVYVYVYAYMYVYVYMYVCVSVYGREYQCRHMYVYLYAYMNVIVHVYVYANETKGDQNTIAPHLLKTTDDNAKWIE